MDEYNKILPTPGQSTSQNVDKGADGLPTKPPRDIRKDVQSGSSLEPQLTNQDKVDIIPRFLVVKRKEGDFTNVSPFLINKVLCSLVGAVTSVRKIREGLLIETSSTIQASKLLKVEKFYEFEVSVVPHASLNYTKGVITCRDLLNCSLVEIIENMAEEGVIDAKRITVRREGVLKETASLILTFKRVKLPNKVKAGIYILPVRAYIPAPLRCFRCQRFGHISSRCDRSEICVCGKELHVGSPCVDPIKCVNCNGDHSARSKNCPEYKKEAAIQKLKTEEKISFAEARRRVQISMVTPVPGVSYSQAASTPPLTIPTDIIKDMISKLVPDIVKICTDTIKQSTTSKPSVARKINVQSAPNQIDDNDSIQTDASTSRDKRKRGDNTPSDTEYIDWEEQLDTNDVHTNNRTHSETATPRLRKGKPGWKKGRPRKR